VAIALMLAASAACAQEYNFRNLSVADGLAQSQVYAICQDTRGEIWFGTRGGGISRFDGMTFTTISEENGLANNYVRAILEDRAGTIWIGTDRGAVRYDGRRFTHLGAREGLTDLPIFAIAQDSSGAIWFTSEGGFLARYSAGHVRRFDRDDGLPAGRCQSLFVDHGGRVWVGMDDGAAIFDGARFTRLAFERSVHTLVTAIGEDRSGIYWLATYGNGVARYDGHAFTWLNAGNGLSNNTVLALYIAPGGELWIGTAGGGVDRYDGRGVGVFTETEGLCNNVIASIMRDSDGDLWFGSSGGGVSRYDGARFIHFTERQGKLGNWIYAIHQDRSGGIWFGNSSGGATRYDGTYYARHSAADGFTSGKVKCIFEDRAGTLWFGTVGEGLFSYDGHAFKMVAGLRAAFINAITQDGRGDLWLGCADAGVVRFSPGASDPHDRFRYVTRDAGLGYVRVYDILADGDDLWAATDGAGLFHIVARADSERIAIDRITMSNGLTSNSLRTIARDRRGALLLGTAGGGIDIVRDGNVRSIRRAQGISSNNIYSLVVDSAGAIWIGTEKGIDRAVIDAEYNVRSIKHYGKGEGIRGVETTQNAACVDNAGNVWFGTIQGAVRYDPREDRPNNVPPMTHITGIRLFFDKIETTPYADSLTSWYPIPASLTLPYDQNSLSFDFVGISQRNPQGVRYRWKLDGFDRDWSPISTERRAVYSNLGPGSYTLMVRSFNEDGVADPRPAAFSFTIGPPFWGTWWFQALAIIAAIGAIGGSVMAWVAKIRRENARERMELEMRKNIVELEQKSLRLAMNPHFIFNALNSIGAFIAANNPTVARRYLSKFARLMRLILQNSREELVPLADEVAMLTGYLDLECLNAPRPFEYEVSIDRAIDPEAIAIPTMLIQPLVENAVLHGLRGKGENGKIVITLSLDGALVRCSVADNGIGRERARALAGPPRKEHASTAMAVIDERLAIMRRQLGHDARFAINDLRDAAGEPCGTEAVIHLPYQAM
jgi:ligand-binding sensor domain-containing protein/signal transduction histidine kinase